MFPFGPGGIETFVGSMMAFAVVPYVLLGLAIPYAVLYMRDSRNEEHDAEIGLKSALYFMLSLSILLILTGLTIIVVDFLEDNRATGPGSRPFSDFTRGQRNGFAMMVSGFAI